MDNDNAIIPTGNGGLRPTIPRGLRDILPDESYERRQLENQLRQTFAAWGYGEVITPIFEYYLILATEAGESLKKEMFRFFDSDRRQLALRPEMTIPISRLVAQRLDPESEPYRLYYVANVFREEPAHKGQAREFSQAGIELVGAGGPVADAEVIAVLVESLVKSGLKKFQIGLGHTGFFRAILKSLEINRQERRWLETAVSERDLVATRNFLDRLAITSKDKKALLKIISRRGGTEILDAAESLYPDPKFKDIIAGLRTTISCLNDLELENRLIIDLGIIRDFDYYTGMIFEVYCPELGFPLGGGGRYDNLLSEFGRRSPAAGFALDLDCLRVALIEQGQVNPRPREKYLVYSKRPEQALAKAAKLRAAGKIAESVLRPADAKLAQKIADARGITKLVGV